MNAYTDPKQAKIKELGLQNLTKTCLVKSEILGSKREIRAQNWA